MADASFRTSQTCLILAVAVLALTYHHAEAIDCGQVTRYIAPCAGYVLGRGPLTPPCCNGIRGLTGAAATTADRQVACTCLKGFAGRLGSFNPGKAAGIPGACGVSVPYPISTSVDCSKIR